MPHPSARSVFAPNYPVAIAAPSVWKNEENVPFAEIFGRGPRDCSLAGAVNGFTRPPERGTRLFVCLL